MFERNQPQDRTSTRRAWWRATVAFSAAVAAAVGGAGAAAALAHSSHGGRAGSARAVADDTTTTTTDTTSTDTTSTGTTTNPPPPPPAPPGFADSITSLYSTMYQTAQTLDTQTGQTSSQQLTAPSSFTQSIQSLTPDQIAYIYEATQQDPNWNQVAPDAQQLLQDAQTEPSAASSSSKQSATRSSARSSVRSRASKTARVASATMPLATVAAASTNTFPPDEPIGNFPAAPAPFQPPSASAFSGLTCVPGGNTYDYETASESALLIAQTVARVADFSQGWLSDTQETTLVFLVTVNVPNPAKVALSALKLAGTIVVNSFIYANALVKDCGAANTTGLVEQLDDTTVNGYNLEQQNEGTIAAIESSINTIHAQVHVVQQTVDDQLTLDIRQALSQPTTAPHNIDYELPASAGGNLDSVPIGVQAIVTGAYNATQQAGLAINATASSDLAAANNALRTKNYRTAWTDYQAAYQALR